MVKRFFTEQLRALALYGGSLLVVAWTLIRHFSNGVNFDVVGQIVLADQWTHGLHSGAQLGATNYLLKMPLYVFVNSLGFLSPHQRLLLLILVFNLATFAGIFLLSEKIVRSFGVRDLSWLYIGLLWLASISGRVFWLDYPNSRNLEVVGGLLLLYLVLRWAGSRSLRQTAALVGCAGVVFFSDPLQFYMVGLPLITYYVAVWLYRRRAGGRAVAGWVGATMLAGLAAAKILALLATKLLPAEFLKVPRSGPSLHAVAGSSFRIFDADLLARPFGPNSLRHALNLILLIGFSYILFRGIRAKAAVRRPSGGLLPLLVLVGYAVYIVSGLGSQWATERYIVMVPLYAVLLIGLWAGPNLGDWSEQVRLAALGVILLSSLLVFGATLKSIPSRYSHDAYAVSAASYLRSGHYEYGLASRQVAIPATYFAGRQATVIPMLCQADNRRLAATNLFFDSAALRVPASYHGLVPILLQTGGTISQAGVSCNEGDIIKQFGQPVRQETVPDVGMALLYQAKVFRTKHNQLQ